MPKTRKYRSGPEILAILKRHLVDKEELSKICEEEDINPSQFYRWQAVLFSEGAAVFERKSSATRREFVKLQSEMECRGRRISCPERYLS